MFEHFAPERRIVPLEWKRRWEREQVRSVASGGRALAAVLGVLAVVHFFAIDIPRGKTPIERYFFYRFSVALVAAATCAATLVKNVRLPWVRLMVAAFGATVVFAQSQSMVWSADVPYLYVPILATIAVLPLQLPVLSSALAFGLLVSFGWAGFQARPLPPHHLLSACLVALGVVAIVRSRMASDVQRFILEQEYREWREREAEFEVRRLKRLEGELEQSREFSLTATRMAHDIRSPLTALTALHSTDAAAENDARKELLSGAIERIQRVAETLLSGRPRIEGVITAEDIGMACGAVLAETRVRHRDTKNIRWHLESAKGGSEGRYQVSLSELQRAIVNLMNNAAEAIDLEGSVTVSIAETETELAVVVTDTGQGMSDDLLARLGREGVTHGKTNGHGIGIPAVKAFAERLGGSLSIQSALGRGTRAVVVIPRQVYQGGPFPRTPLT